MPKFIDGNAFTVALLLKFLGMAPLLWLAF